MSRPRSIPVPSRASPHPGRESDREPSGAGGGPQGPGVGALLCGPGAGAGADPSEHRGPAPTLGSELPQRQEVGTRRAAGACIQEGGVGPRSLPGCSDCPLWSGALRHYLVDSGARDPILSVLGGPRSPVLLRTVVGDLAGWARGTWAWGVLGTWPWEVMGGQNCQGPRGASAAYTRGPAFSLGLPHRMPGPLPGRQGSFRKGWLPIFPPSWGSPLFHLQRGLSVPPSVHSPASRSWVWVVQPHPAWHSCSQVLATLVSVSPCPPVLLSLFACFPGGISGLKTKVTPSL